MYVEVVVQQFDYAIEELDPETLYYEPNFEDEDFEDFFEDMTPQQGGTDVIS